MNATQSKQLPARLTVVFTLSRLLQRLEQSQQPVGADQYKAIVDRLSDELSRTEMDDSLRLLLNAHPAAAELYENLNYQHAGLCRSPLEASMQAELAAKDVIARAARSDAPLAPPTGERSE